MWWLSDLQPAPYVLGEGSSGTGPYAVTAVFADGVPLINGIEAIEVLADGTQVHVCDDCGTPGCAPGGWVSFRRIGPTVLWLPAWEWMEEGDDAKREFGPPSYLRDVGIPALSTDLWERLRRLVGELPAFEAVPALSSREAVRMCQWSAPGRLLGRFPSAPALRRELVLAVTRGERRAELDAIDACLSRHLEADWPLSVVRPPRDVQPVELWIDVPGTPGWTGFGHAGGRTCLMFDENLAVERMEASRRPTG